MSGSAAKSPAHRAKSVQMGLGRSMHGQGKSKAFQTAAIDVMVAS